jgi:hypothetical protein
LASSTSLYRPTPFCRHFFLNSSSMQRRSSPSFPPPSSCYPIPCTTSTNLLPKKR